MKDKIFTLCIVLFLVAGLYFSLKMATSKEDVSQVKQKDSLSTDNHYYDYIIEVYGDDSIPTYDLYDGSHNIVASNIKSSELDSVIIKDNE